MRHLLVPCVLALVCGPVAADAQDDPLRDRDVHGFVTLRSGGPVVTGTLSAFTSDAVTIVIDGAPRTYQLSDVRRVERAGDPSGDGAWKGGLLLGALCVLVCQQGVDSGAEFVGVLVVNTAFGAYLGRQADRQHEGRTTLYRERRGATGGPRRLALTYRLRF